MALASIADDGNFLSLQVVEIRILVVIDFHALLLVSRPLYRVGLRPHIDHFPSEDIDDPEDLLPSLGVGRDLYEYHLPFYKILIDEINHLDHRDNFVELFDHLLDDLVIPTTDK